MLDRWRRMTSAQQGFIVWMVIVVAWFAFWFVVDPGGGGEGAEFVEGDSEAADQAADEAMEGMRPWIIWIGAALISAVVLTVWALVHLVRDRGVKFEDLDDEEQHRREEAGRMLHDLGNPPSRLTTGAAEVLAEVRAEKEREDEELADQIAERHRQRGIDGSGRH